MLIAVRAVLGSITPLMLFIAGVFTLDTPESASPKPPVFVSFGPTTTMVNKQLSVRSLEVKKSPAIVFTHGDILWLPALAAEAGWPEHTWEKLGEIILRESGGCPNRRGGDKVDKDCNITGVSEWNHRSDTGLLQINGVNYDITRNKWAAICRELNICTQAPLLDPLTNLKAGLVLYKLSGFDPWDPCTWDKAKCPKKKP